MSSDSTPSVGDCLRMMRSVSRWLRRIPWWIWVIVIVALLTRLALVPFGLPYELDPDEHLFVDAAWQQVQSGIGDPAWYNVPASTLMDIMAALFAGQGGLDVLAGRAETIQGAGDLYLADASQFFLIGRIVVVISGLGVVLMTYVLAREIRVSRFWAAVGSLVIAVSFAMVQFSALIRPDMLMTFFLLAAVLVSLRSLLHPSGRIFALAGACLGLAAASKYPGALAIAPIVAANATLTVEYRITPRRGLLWLGIAVACAAVAAFVVGPYLFIHVDQTIWAIGQEARSQHVGATGQGLAVGLWRYLTEAMVWGLGVPTAVFGVAGLGVMLLKRRPRVVAVTFWILLLFISFLSLWWLRWAIPLFPLAAVGAAYLADRTERRLAAKWPGAWLRASAAVVAALMVLPLVVPTAEQVSAYASGDDTRLSANEWINANAPPGSTILVDSYSAQVSSDTYDVRFVYQGEIASWSDDFGQARPFGYIGRLGGQWLGSPDELVAAIAEAGVDYIALSDTWIDLFREEATNYPEVLPRYQVLLDTYPLVARFDRTTNRLGAPVSILAGPGAPEQDSPAAD